MFHYLQASIVSEKSVLNLIFVPLKVVDLILTALKIFSLSLIFSILKWFSAYDIPVCGDFLFFPFLTQDSLNFLGLWFMSFINLGKFLAIICSKLLYPIFSFICFWDTHYSCDRPFAIIPYISDLCSFLFFSLCILQFG